MLDVGFNPEQAPVPESFTKGKKKDFNDPRFFKAAIKNPKKPRASDANKPSVYQALIRILPRGRDFTKPFVVDVQRHNFDEGGVFCNILCRKTIHKDEFCPFCEDNWKNFKIARASNNKAVEAQYTARRNKVEHICNILVVNDLTNPANNGKVMLWKMPNTIFKMLVEASNKDKQPKKKGSAFSSNAVEVVEPVFYPQDPVNGRDLELSVSPDNDNGIATYEASSWFEVEKPKPIASTNEAIFKILDECNDLSEFVANVPSVDKVSAELAAFQGRVNAKLTQGAAHENSTNQSAFQASQGVFNTAPVVKPPEMGNSSELFKAPAPASMAAPTPTATPAPQPAPAMPSMAGDGDGDGEDDLPF
jgi:hypothetical protein